LFVKHSSLVWIIDFLIIGLICVIRLNQWTSLKKIMKKTMFSREMMWVTVTK